MPVRATVGGDLALKRRDIGEMSGSPTPQLMPFGYKGRHVTDARDVIIKLRLLAADGMAIPVLKVGAGRYKIPPEHFIEVLGGIVRDLEGAKYRNGAWLGNVKYLCSVFNTNHRKMKKARRKLRFDVVLSVASWNALKDKFGDPAKDDTA